MSACGFCGAAAVVAAAPVPHYDSPSGDLGYEEVLCCKAPWSHTGRPADEVAKVITGIYRAGGVGWSTRGEVSKTPTLSKDTDTHRHRRRTDPGGALLR